ncbi:hypothetical protein BVRB_4g086970 [Beta vulgaris subsp. vulgaris]|uniref:Uncharacterized protein n=1 Tax=Beta vulgaris subsp. vulgaris TaxID=3555 RepID=A0A0J8CM19_BETVV|nr:hypothetical protein BVRB_4g086970 [Beta vulgaris subsp. vulgaris]
MSFFFYEAYRADIAIHTDSGGQIYAHANILHDVDAGVLKKVVLAEGVVVTVKGA